MDERHEFGHGCTLTYSAHCCASRRAHPALRYQCPTGHNMLTRLVEATKAVRPQAMFNAERAKTTCQKNVSTQQCVLQLYRRIATNCLALRCAALPQRSISAVLTRVSDANPKEVYCICKQSLPHTCPIVAWHVQPGGCCRPVHCARQAHNLSARAHMHCKCPCLRRQLSVWPCRTCNDTYVATRNVGTSSHCKEALIATRNV